MELLSGAEVTTARMLASVTVKDLNLPSGTSAGKVSALTEACERAAELKQAPRAAAGAQEEGEVAVSGAHLITVCRLLRSLPPLIL